MGAGASTRRATISTFAHPHVEDRHGQLQSTVEVENAAKMLRANSAPPRQTDSLKAAHSSSDDKKEQGGGTNVEASPGGFPPGVPLHTSSSAGTVGGGPNGGEKVGEKGTVSFGESVTQRNEFHTLQEQVHKKRTGGASYGEIFNQLAAQAKEEKKGRRGSGGKHRRRATEEEWTRQAPLPAIPSAKPFRGLPGIRNRQSMGKDAIRRPPGRNAAKVSRPSKDPKNGRREIAGGLGANGVSRGSSGGRPAHPDLAPHMSILAPVEDPFADSPDEGLPPLNSRRGPDTASCNKPSRRAQIFDKGVDASMMEDLLKDEVDGEDAGRSLARSGLIHDQVLMGKQATDIVIGALQKFFFLNNEPDEKAEGEEGEQSGGMAMLMRAMEREEHEVGELLIEQGEEGHYMFVVEEGSLEIIIDNEAVRVIGVGDRVGELALLCNAPRSASVRTLSPCVLWSIHREVFKAVQALTASGNLIARSTHLYHVPWLRLLGTTDLSKLAACFGSAQYKDGEVILAEGEATDRCFLIESGEVVCSSRHARDNIPSGDEPQDEAHTKDANGAQPVKITAGVDICEGVERLMMVSRPRKRSSSSNGETGGPGAPRPGTARNSLGGAMVGRDSFQGRSSTSKPGGALLDRAQGHLNMGGVNGMGAQQSECEPYWDVDRGEVLFGKGCFLGVPVLMASAELDLEGLPGWELATPPLDATHVFGDLDEDPAPKAFSALSPVTLVARGEVRIGHFDVARFTKTVGPFAKVLGAIGQGHRMMSPLRRSMRGRNSVTRSSLHTSPGGGLALKYEKLTVHDFERTDFLGQGSFGYVTMVRKKKGIMEGVMFALKSLSKRAVVEAGQVQHIKDEKKVLELFGHPFVLRLYTTFQDVNRVYFLTELLEAGELWSVIYESASGFESGLPLDHVVFYSAVVVEALAYIHKKGIAYRDLKPENLIVDCTGYLRIVDMGFAKHIPFLVTIGGETKMHPRSHTMCGTPEYLAPEFIFNKGHDQSADLWALGVLIFELVEAQTPFAAPGLEHDITKLFTNIACVKKRGVEFPESFDDKAGGGSECRDLISGMLAFEPGDRLGNLAGGMDDVKGHGMYKGLDWEGLVAKSISAPWVPEGPAPRSEPESIPCANDVYTGEQNYFADF